MNRRPGRRIVMVTAMAVIFVILAIIVLEKIPLLKAGDTAPDFEATTNTGERIRLSDFLGKQNVVLYFYPKDFTAGCTAQACSFRDNYARISAFDAVIFGISYDDAASHKRFSSSNSLQYPLLSDAERSIAKLFGAARILGPVKRVTFVIDKSGIIRYVAHHELAIGNHLEDVLRALGELQKKQTP